MADNENAFLSWDHHEGVDRREALAGYHRDSYKTITFDNVARLTRTAFEAGWEAAGGEARDNALEAIAGLLDECCGDTKNCLGCGALVEVRRALGVEDDDA